MDALFLFGYYADFLGGVFTQRCCFPDGFLWCQVSSKLFLHVKSVMDISVKVFRRYNYHVFKHSFSGTTMCSSKHDMFFRDYSLSHWLHMLNVSLEDRFLVNFYEISTEYNILRWFCWIAYGWMFKCVLLIRITYVLHFCAFNLVLGSFFCRSSWSGYWILNADKFCVYFPLVLWIVVSLFCRKFELNDNYHMSFLFWVLPACSTCFYFLLYCICRIRDLRLLGFFCFFFFCSSFEH